MMLTLRASDGGSQNEFEFSENERTNKRNATCNTHWFQVTFLRTVAVFSIYFSLAAGIRHAMLDKILTIENEGSVQCLQEKQLTILESLGTIRTTHEYATVYS